uniref:Uncharacterized protein n=1 Tax=Romanomermis culicivorax TaxID=13658 RepID=A0A915JHI9_ROMCU
MIVMKKMAIDDFKDGLLVRFSSARGNEEALMGLIEDPAFGEAIRESRRLEPAFGATTVQSATLERLSQL